MDGQDGQDGKSGVWVGEDEPTDEEYVVWIDPDGTQSTIPTKTSDLTNDSGFITVEKIGYTEHLTNKIYVDSNNDEHPVYSKIIPISSSSPTTVTIDGYTYDGFAHNISNYGRLISIKPHYNAYQVEMVDTYEVFVNNTYVLFLGNTFYTGFDEVIMEYTKTS